MPHDAATAIACCGTNAAPATPSIRRRFTNNPNQTLTSLRLRVTDITTLKSPVYALGGAKADLRLTGPPD